MRAREGGLFLETSPEAARLKRHEVRTPQKRWRCAFLRPGSCSCSDRVPGSSLSLPLVVLPHLTHPAYFLLGTSNPPLSRPRFVPTSAALRETGSLRFSETLRNNMAPKDRKGRGAAGAKSGEDDRDEPLQAVVCFSPPPS